ncbi:MAG: DUF1570 domain-containing protein [Pirellulales bacterium]
MACLVAVAAMAVGSPADEFTRSRAELEAKYARELGTLATWCRQQGLTEPAKQVERWLRPRDPRKLYLVIPPPAAGTTEPPAGAPAEKAPWEQRFQKLRADEATALFDLARRAIRARRVSLAFELVLEAVRENPDHEPARRLLGYQRYRDGWYTPFEVRKFRAGQVWDDKYGWLPKASVERYRKGERFAGGRWVSAADDARLHRDIGSGWDIETEHYVVRTNHSLEAGVELGVRLEQLYRVWQQVFVRYYATESQLAALFEGRSGDRRTARRHRVVYFRTRDEYKQALRAAQPQIDITTGMYLASQEAAFFFAGDEQDDGTLYHEATHQLFHETRPVSPRVGLAANFWIVEGVALYMESLARQDGFYTLGGFDNPRMEAARYRLLEDHFYVPLAQLATYGMEKLQSDERIATLYSQSAGLTHFLMHYDQGRYRDALVAYLAIVYAGRDTPRTLAELTGVPFDQLDRQYREFMTGGQSNDEGKKGD